jgi:hypothetical protein
MSDESTPEPELTPLEKAEARRADRKAEARKAHDAQKAIDLDAITDLETEHGDGNVSVIHLPFTAGLPTCVACRCPKIPEMKRYQARLKPKHEKDHPDAVAAAEELAAICRIFPADKETYEKLCASRPGIAVQLGVEAMRLGSGKVDAEGKD